MNDTSANGNASDTLLITNGVTMTFLRNHKYLARLHVSANNDVKELAVPLHWHETHDELIRVVQGRIEITMNNKPRIYYPDDGEIVIPKGVVHGTRCFRGEETIFEERTDPMDEEKELFFRNLLANGLPSNNVFDVMLNAYHGDVRPAFPLHIQWLEKLMVVIFGYYLATLLGYKRRYNTLKDQN